MCDIIYIVYIKRVEIQGFKTFADRTQVDLTSGITAVVGPNGSGKSNIADAISWVLGEQNVRNLRGVRAQDVIFAGSEKRKPLGMAEVSLTLDNSCGTLPVNFNEVTVTRRVYRSGDGEYFINKAPCRLKDIFELFLDTGMGREAYSMVSQGEIDAILSAKSEDRRSLFEEAAGIKKYRHRRKEAARKLENTESNLRRVNDIVTELDVQVEPLREQAEVAARYNDLTTRLREIETGLLINDLRRWSGELDRTGKLKIESAGRLTLQDKRISDLEWEKDKLVTQLSELDRRVETARTRYQEALAASHRIKSGLALAEERRRSAEDAKVRLESSIEQTNRRIQESSERIERLEMEEAGCAERETSLATEVFEQTRQLEQVTADLESASRIVEDRKSAYVELAREQASKRTELDNLTARQVQLETALAKYTAELESFEKTREETAAKHAEVTARLEELRAEAKSRGEELPPLKARRESAQSRAQAASQKLDQMNRTAVGKGSRLAALTEMAEAHEGFFEGVRSVMLARKAGKIQGHFAVVADVVSVPEGLETAIEVALGAAVQDVICETTDDAKDAIRFLKENRLGRATFLPLNGVRSGHSNVSGNLKRPGFMGFASDLVDYDQKYYPAINVLLGRVMVVDNIDNAVRISRETSGWGRIVTLEGEVVVPTGAMTGGTRQSKGPGLLARKQEIDTLTRELAQLESVRAKTERELDSAREEFVSVAARVDELEKAESAGRFALVEAERQFEFLGRESIRIKQQIEVVGIEKRDVLESLAADCKGIGELKGQLSAAGKENTDLDEYVANAQKRIEELSARREAIGESYMEASVMLASVRERHTGLTQSIKQTKTALAEMIAELANRQADVDKQLSEAEANARERETLSTNITETEATLESAKGNLDELVAKHTELAGIVATGDAELKTLHRGRAETAETLRDCDVRGARLEVQITQISERLFEEYEITAEEALAREEAVEIERGTATEVGRLRKEIKAMGLVNIGAVGEYERVRERWEFLTSQRDDLVEARTKLNNAIKEIDDSTRELFLDTFHKIAEHFDIMFKRLFGGGKTELVLTDPANLLETGVEVIVQPLGKKLQNLQLLSGGERALTASALLFALLMVRPSPFVMFDEVDAPLDDSNVERFADVLREFTEHSQFIIVTHNRATMEKADNLYGVAMQEPGVSRLLSVRLADETERHELGEEIIMVPA